MMNVSDKKQGISKGNSKMKEKRARNDKIVTRNEDVRRSSETVEGGAELQSMLKRLR